jgi:hypothetical protein
MVHYTFDVWMGVNYSSTPWFRYADEGPSCIAEPSLRGKVPMGLLGEVPGMLT